jgi:hypothetical protein
MYPSLLFVVEIDRARRREAEHRAAHWRLARTLPRSSYKKQALRGLRRRFCLLARIGDWQLLRAPLREYAAR